MVNRIIMKKAPQNNIDFFNTQADSIFNNSVTKFYHMAFVGKSDTDFLQYIINEAEIKSRSRVLDIGCGSGYLVHELAKICEAEGVTNSKENLKVCKKLYPENKYILGDMETIESSGKTHCIFLESFSYGDIEKSFKNCYKNLSPGGILFMKEWCRVEEETKETKENINALEETFFYSPHLLSTLLNEAQQNGFHLMDEKNLIHEINSQPYVATLPYHNDSVKNFRFPYPDAATVIPVQLKFRKR